MSACTPKRDADLLLLAHGELGRLERVATTLHVKRCACCRERLQQFAAVSGVMKASVLGLSSAKIAYAFDIEDVPWKALVGRRLLVGVALLSVLWWWFLATQARADGPPANRSQLAVTPAESCGPGDQKLATPPVPPAKPAALKAVTKGGACKTKP